MKGSFDCWPRLGLKMATGTYPTEWPPIPVPARTKFYLSGYPYSYTGRKMVPYPYPAGNLYPTGNPYPKSIPENYI